MGAEELDLHTRQLGRRIAHLSSLSWHKIDAALAPSAQAQDHADRACGDPLAEGSACSTVRSSSCGRLIRRPIPRWRCVLPPQPRATACPLSAGSATRLAADDGRDARSVADVVDAADGRPADSRAGAHARVGRARLRRRRSIGGCPNGTRSGCAARRRRSTASRSTGTAWRPACYAAKVQRDVARPDLLAVAALLHDIGKGVEGDHSRGRRADGRTHRDAVGLYAEDAADDRPSSYGGTCCCRRSPRGATSRTRRRRRMSPRSWRPSDFLDLLAALTASDAQATGSAAWTTWRKGLIEGLVDKVAGELDDAVTTPDAQAIRGVARRRADPGLRRHRPGRLHARRSRPQGRFPAHRRHLRPAAA